MSHMLKDIAVFFDDSAAGLRILESAARLASAQDAHLIGLSSINENESHPGDGFALGHAVHEVVTRRLQSVAMRLAQARQALSKAAARHGVTEEFRVLPHTQNGGEVALHSLYCDLLMVGQPATGAPQSWSATQVLQRTGMPLLIVPQDWRGDTIGRRIVMTWNASRQARRALADALPLMTLAESVDVLIVDPEHDGDRHGEEPGADIAAYLARHQVHVEARPVASQKRAIAETILQEASDRNADLVVFGAYSRPRLSEAVFGGVTRTLLESEHLPLFVSH